MSLTPYNRQTAGEVPSSRQTNRLQTDLERLSQITAAGELTVSEDAGGRGVQDVGLKGFPARITNHATGNAYGFLRLDESEPGTFPDLESEQPESGNGTDLAAYELTGLTTVPTNTKVMLYPLGFAPGYVFTATPCGWCADYYTANVPTGGVSPVGTVGDALSWVLVGAGTVTDARDVAETTLTIPAGSGPVVVHGAFHGYFQWLSTGSYGSAWAWMTATVKLLSGAGGLASATIPVFGAQLYAFLDDVMGGPLQTGIFTGDEIEDSGSLGFYQGRGGIYYRINVEDEDVVLLWRVTTRLSTAPEVTSVDSDWTGRFGPLNIGNGGTYLAYDKLCCAGGCAPAAP